MRVNVQKLLITWSILMTPRVVEHLLRPAIVDGIESACEEKRGDREEEKRGEIRDERRPWRREERREERDKLQKIQISRFTQAIVVVRPKMIYNTILTFFISLYTQ
jgi:hypothetical protein